MKHLFFFGMFLLIIVANIEATRLNSVVTLGDNKDMDYKVKSRLLLQEQSPTNAFLCAFCPPVAACQDFSWCFGVKEEKSSDKKESTQENTAPAEEDAEALARLEKFCESNCLVEALTNAKAKISENCDELCPDYAIPTRYRRANSTCNKCPDNDCLRCSCATGKCELCCSCDLTHINFCDCKTEICCPCTEKHYNFVPTECTYFDDGTAVCSAQTISVDTFTCARCDPEKTCRNFWWCQQQSSP